MPSPYTAIKFKVVLLFYHRSARKASLSRYAVEISDKDTISDLAKEVASEEGVKRYQVVLWKPRMGVNTGAELQYQLQEHNNDIAEFCENATDMDIELTVYKLLGATKSTRTASRTALVAEIHSPPVAERATDRLGGDADDVLSELRKDYNRTIDAARRGGSTSANIKSTSYSDRQREAPILDGLYPAGYGPTAAPPIELYHPVFARFLANANKVDLDVPDDVIQQTAKIMEAASHIVAHEAYRERSIRRLLADILGYGFDQIANHCETSADHIAAVSRDHEPAELAALVIAEEKYELGWSGDPSVQGPLSYLAFWSEPSRDRLRDLSCCPSFVVGIAGPWLVILGCVWTSSVIAQRLTDYMWIGNSRVIDDAIPLRLARQFYALRLAANELRDYYLDLSVDTDRSLRFFPSVMSYTKTTVTRYFRYMKPLESDKGCVTFLADQLPLAHDPEVGGPVNEEEQQEDSQSLGLDEDDDNDESEDGRRVVVKFVERYGREVHTLLASHGLAPKLLYYGPISKDSTLCYGGRRLVVIEYIEGESLYDVYVRKGKPVPRKVRERIHDAVKILQGQETPLVHGDIRETNIILENGPGKPEDRLKIIDFDWAGEENVVRYPLHLATAGRPDGVEDYGLIKCEHDTKMVEKL